MLISLRGIGPLYRQIYEQIRQKVLAGELPAGTRLPSSRELAVQLDVSRTSVLQAFEQLGAEGYTETRAGSGTFVAASLPAANEAGVLDRESGNGVETSGQPLDAQLSRAGLAIQQVLGDYRRPWETSSSPRFDFRLGGVSLHGRSQAQWRRMINDGAKKVPATLEHPQGNLQLRKAIAHYLQINRRCHCSEKNIVVINGSQQAFDLLARLLLNPGDTVALESPGYIGAQYLFAAHCATLHQVAVDEQGILVDALNDNKQSAKLVYVTPSHQFPTGVVMSLSRRISLIQWAREHDAYILEDDYDSEYRYDGRPIESVQGLDEFGRTIYVGTFSKVLFPSLRLGYMVLPEALVEPVIALRWMTDFQSPGLQQAAMARWMEEGHHYQHVRRMSKIYSGRRDILVASLREHFDSEEIEIIGDNAGLHLMLALKKIPVDDIPELLTQCAKSGLGVFPADMNSNVLQCAALVLGFTAIEEDSIEQGVASLQSVVRARQFQSGRESEAAHKI